MDLDPERWLTEHGDALFRFALLRTSRRDIAEDLVQETLLAAWRSRDGFRRDASERTWLVGILKNKIRDHYRDQGKQENLATRVAEDDGQDDLDRWFDETGHWRVRPARWGSDPLTQVELEGFWLVLSECIDALPERLRDGFIARELSALTSREVCELLKISDNNLYVLLHRARLRIRECVENGWFKKEDHRS
ncbi:MAG TPA: sigma-70 family RNA polymerase sigma factor [Gammaproteobacteria bacterium]|nr:sigma-70 family RNA polymerase sigma factor [Gammaproteobacteria bacterium]